MSSFLPILILLLFIILFLSLKCLSLSRRINEIRHIIKAMSQGDYSSRMDLAFSDKLGDIARNINELTSNIQKRIQELVNEKEKLETVLSNMAEGVLVISADSRLIHLNPRFKDMFDIRSNNWQNKFYWEIISNQILNESVKDVLNNKSILRKEVMMIRPQETYFDIQISPIMDDQKKLMSLVVVCHDVTELKKFERLRSEFVANVSHELKTPLTSIRGFIETLREGAIHDRANAARFLDIVYQQTLRLGNLVDDILVLSSLESKDIKIELTKTDLAVVIHAVVLLKKKHIEDLKHTLILDIPNPLPLIPMDRGRMEQVLLNLLDNAVKFTPAGGKIQIRVSLESNQVRLDLTDNGPGIPAEHINRIFERFFRVDPARSKDTGGTGLGLSIVKHIIDLHKGRIQVQSILGFGTTFSLFLNQDML